MQSLDLTILTRKRLRDLLLSREGRGEAGLCPSHRLAHLIKRALLYCKLNPSVADSHFKRGTVLEGKRGAGKVSGWFLSTYVCDTARHRAQNDLVSSKHRAAARRQRPLRRGPERKCSTLCSLVSMHKHMRICDSLFNSEAIEERKAVQRGGGGGGGRKEGNVEAFWVCSLRCIYVCDYIRIYITAYSTARRSRRRLYAY